MYILNNALKSITRNLSRNILISIIIIIVSTSSFVSLSINNSSKKLIESYENSNAVIAELTVNRENLRKNVRGREDDSSSPQDFIDNIEKLNVTDIENYGKSIYVKEYYYDIRTEMNSTNIKKATQEVEENSQEQAPMMMQRGNMENNQNMKNVVVGDFNVIGYSSINGMDEFKTGTYKISDGAMFEENSENYDCVISQDLAEENDLQIGSKIILNNINNEEEAYEFNVCGIYTDYTQSNEFSMFSNSANQILTSYNSLNSIIEKSKENTETMLNGQINVKFELISKNSISKFEEELKEKGLSDYYTLTSNVDTLENNLKPIENLSTFSKIFFIIVLVIGAVILVIINMINIRERKYEIGVLRSIGMKKRLVSLQFVIELFIVTFISIIIGAIIGSVITVPITNNLLQSEINSLNEEKEEINQNFGFKDKSMGMDRPSDDIREMFGNQELNYVDKLNVIVDFSVILKLIGVGILLTLISSTISVIFISRYSPLKILSNRT